MTDPSIPIPANRRDRRILVVVTVMRERERGLYAVDVMSTSGTTRDHARSLETALDRAKAIVTVHADVASFDPPFGAPPDALTDALAEVGRLRAEVASLRKEIPVEFEEEEDEPY